MSTIIFIADGWGSKYGGINSFNYDLCLNLPLNLSCEEHKVICITTGDALSEKDLNLARERNLILINLAKSDFTHSIMKAKTSEYCVGTDIWWIGHDIKTGSYAVQCACDTNSKCAIIHHMNYSAYYTYSTNNPIKTEEKQKEQLNLFEKADVIFAVGPKLVKSANDILIKLHKKSDAIQLIPGIADIVPIEESLNQFTAITFGRLNINEKDIIKQCKLAVAAFAYACEKENDFSRDDAEISLVGLNDNEIEKINIELRTYAEKFTGGIINSKGYPYTENRSDLFNMLKYSSVCMMLSLHEGFGLAGWEAISAGIPLIISENSGLFEFLKSIDAGLEVYSLRIKGDLDKKYESTDIKNVSNALISIKKDLKAYKKKAIVLREELINQGFTWTNTSLKLIEGLEITSKTKSQTKQLLSIIKTQFETVLDKETVNSNWTEICNEFEKSKVYDKVRDTHSDIAEDLETSGFLKIHGMRASTFCPSNDNDITDVLNKKDNINIEILSAYPFSEYIRKRLITIKKYRDSEQDLITHHQELYDTAKTFKKRQQYNTRFFVLPLSFRLYFTQQHLYMSYYEDGIHARYLKVFRFDANTIMYHVFESYYKEIWKSSTDELPDKAEEVSSEYRYIFGDKWPVQPSLVINVCSTCNMKCKYCPTGGENLNLISAKEYCSNKDLATLVKIFPSCGGKTAVRITGGEPLLNKTIRERTNSVLKSAKNYDKIVLCTNAVYLQEAYEESGNLWRSLKDKLLLKISLDTLNSQYFKEITCTSDQLLEKIITNIYFAKQKELKVELNVVVKKQNVYEIPQIFDFAKELELVGVKILTVNDFGGRIKMDEFEQKYVENALREIADQMRQKGLEERDISLNDGVGIQMKRFIAITRSNAECTFTIVDHNIGENSITPKRTFCEFCRRCRFYPCATGVMNLTLRADGMLSQCRLKTDNTFKINGRTKPKMEKQVKDMLEPFSECFQIKAKEGLVNGKI